ncbi:MAG: hypothetical protein ACTSSA_11055 [Candidatus Freyarchaeota archaeon]
MRIFTSRFKSIAASKNLDLNKQISFFAQIAVLLSVSALGYLAVGFYYLTVLHNPSLYVFKFSSSGWVLMIGWSPEYIVRTIIFMIIDRSLAFQEAVWLLSVQVVFYTLLCVILIATVWGLLRMRNWARVVTLIYFALLFVFAFAAPFYSGYIGYSFFDLNSNIFLTRTLRLCMVLGAFRTACFPTSGNTSFRSPAGRR